MVGDIKILATSLSDFSYHVNGTRYVYNYIYIYERSRNMFTEDALALVDQ